MPPPSPALFLDRDGVINQDVGYLHDPKDVLFLEGIFPLCREARQQGYKLVVITNQAGIARGFYTEAQFQSLMQWMRAQFTQQGIALDAVYHCPYHPDYGPPEYRCEHEDRKPSPGMLFKAQRDLNLDLAQSILIGDRHSDIAAAHAAGLKQAFLIAGTETTENPQPHTKIQTLAEVQTWLEAQR